MQCKARVLREYAVAHVALPGRSVTRVLNKLSCHEESRYGYSYGRAHHCGYSFRGRPVRSCHAPKESGLIRKVTRAVLLIWIWPDRASQVREAAAFEPFDLCAEFAHANHSYLSQPSYRLR